MHMHVFQQAGPDELLGAGNSVCAFIHGFEPYFYVEAPPGFGPDDCDSLRSTLDVRPGCLTSSLLGLMASSGWRRAQCQRHSDPSH